MSKMSSCCNDTKKKGGHMREKVEKAIEKIREFLQQDGGDIEIVDVTDGVAYAAN